MNHRDFLHKLYAEQARLAVGLDREIRYELVKPNRNEEQLAFLRYRRNDALAACDSILEQLQHEPM